MLIVVLSAFLTTVFFKPKDIFSNVPIYHEDYAMHFSQCLSTKRFLSSDGKCWGYDPFFLAGFPRGTLVNADNKAWELFYFIFSPILGEGFAFKAYVLIFLLFYPLFIYGAARNCNLLPEISLIASLLAILFFNLSLAIDFVSWGMVSYVFACFFSIYVFSLYYRLFQEFSLKRYVVVALLSSLLLMMHILSPIHIVVPIMILYLYSIKKMKPFQNMLVIAIVLIIVLINSYWLIPVVEFFSDKTTRQKNWEFALQIKNIFEPFHVYIKQRRSIPHKAPALDNTFIDVLLCIFGSYGFYYWFNKRLFNLLIPFSGGVLFIFIIAYYGSHITFFSQFQPERFTICVGLLCIIPASVAFFEFGRHLFHKQSTPRILFTASICFAVLYQPVLRPFAILYEGKPYHLTCEIPDPLRDLLDFLEEHTGRDGRILIEYSEYSPEDPEPKYYRCCFPALFPEYVQREYLCGPRPIYPIKHSYASYSSGVLFEKDIETYTLKDLKKYFNAYNVKWIVCWSQKSKDFFAQLPKYITPVYEIDKFTVYEVDRRASFFLKGSGTVHADYNRLELHNITPEDGEIILSYHWMEKLKALPETKIEKIALVKDPVGFIKIKNPPHSLTLLNDY